MIAGRDRWVGGFTLIELLVTLAVAVILATVAVPNLQGVIDKNRLEADYFQILNSMRYARTEAMKRRAPVTAVVTPDTDGAGWRLEVKLDDGANLGSIDCTTGSDENCLMVRDNNSYLPSLTTTTSNVIFNQLGRLASAGGNVDIDITHSGDVREVCVELSGNVVGRSCE